MEAEIKDQILKMIDAVAKTFKEILTLSERRIARLRKGESLFDTAQTLGAMNPDLVIIRHGENEASKEIAKILKCPVINAGEGVNEHPTQVLLDAYTIINHDRKLNDITVSICGDLEHSRVARSNYYLLNTMKSKVRFVFPDYFKPKDLDKYEYN